MNKLQIALAFARGEQPKMSDDTPYALLTKADTASTKVYTVTLVEDSGDGEAETLTFNEVYATRELAKRAIEAHVKVCYTHTYGGEEPDSDAADKVEWLNTPDNPVPWVYNVSWSKTGAWAELTITECNLVTE